MKKKLFLMILAALTLAALPAAAEDERTVITVADEQGRPLFAIAGEVREGDTVRIDVGADDRLAATRVSKGE